ncbi:hypothetical protein ASG49_09230 [Marmoricola sp. Leaf446]|uniref:hypothetical protein n=1 Tax=Marmoricola sp. Leaf446 TaxID=1736379 RepID=UPI00071365F2|nr:hypothetical protein [Marmoricola sp. Leaf446]KQT92134.1 hypothetical protein ASG49_09230 [Marmoricola sp. Leaf446]
MTEVVVPRLATRSSRAWVVGTGVALVVVSVAISVVQPASLPFAAGFLVVLGLLAARALSARVRLDDRGGTLTRTRWLARSRRVELAGATDVRLVDNRGGGLNLTVRSPQGTVLVPVLLLSAYVKASQPPGLLRRFADVVERDVPRARDVVTALRAQATHLERGGDAASSPLAALTTRGVVSAAAGGGAAGAGGTIGNLTD